MFQILGLFFKPSYVHEMVGGEERKGREEERLKIVAKAKVQQEPRAK